MSSSDLQADRWVLNFHYVNALTDAGLHVTYDPDSVRGRGLLIGVKPTT